MIVEGSFKLSAAERRIDGLISVNETPGAVPWKSLHFVTIFLCNHMGYRNDICPFVSQELSKEIVEDARDLEARSQL